MPDFERVFRNLELEIAADETERREIKAYHRGLDKARKQIAWIALAVAAIIVLGAWIAG